MSKIKNLVKLKGRERDRIFDIPLSGVYTLKSYLGNVAIFERKINDGVGDKTEVITIKGPDIWLKTGVTITEHCREKKSWGGFHLEGVFDAKPKDSMTYELKEDNGKTKNP